MGKASPKATARGKQPKPKAMPEGKSTMDRIAKGGPKVSSVTERARKGRNFPKGW